MYAHANFVYCSGNSFSFKKKNSTKKVKYIFFHHLNNTHIYQVETRLYETINCDWKMAQYLVKIPILKGDSLTIQLA